MTRSIFQLMMNLLGSGKMDAQVINAGVSGNSTTDMLARINSDVLEARSNLVIVMVGTNDMLNSRKMNSYEVYAANLEKIVSILRDNHAKIVLLSPPPVDSLYLFERHNRDLFLETPEVKMDSVRHIVKRIATQNNTHFVDIYQKFKDLNLPRHNEDLFIMNTNNSGFRDGVHPTRLGYFLIAETVFNYLKNNNLIGENTKITCFGDSITYGSKVKGSGTTSGETYPAYLSKKISDFKLTGLR